MYYEPYDIPLDDYEKYMGTRKYWDNPDELLDKIDRLHSRKYPGIIL